MVLRYLLRGLAAAAYCVAVSTAMIPAEAAERRLMVFEAADYSGFDYKTELDVSLDVCKAACLGDDQCKAFTYNVKASRCFLKSDFGQLTTFDGAVAGRIAAGAPSPDAAPSLDLSFLPDGIADDGRRYLSNLDRASPRSETGFGELVRAAATSIATSNVRGAVNDLKQALSIADDNFESWIALAQALLLVQSNDYSERYQLQEDASAAAFNAIGAAAGSDQQARALAVLAETLERREIWRPAIESYRASLALADAKAVRSAFETLRAERGFRMVDYSVDSEATSPRICIQFSEELASGRVEMADYVTFNGGTAPAVTRESQQLCVDGLEHGERYQIGLRTGLPSALGEVLEKTVELSVYVRDRSPSVRFSGRNYVLPRAGAKGIPVVSVNASVVKAEIHRIGGRALAATMRDGNFLDQLSGWSATNIADDSGSLVWTGEMPVKNELNREVLTAFPVDEVLGDPKPGVYVLSAWAGEEASGDWEDRATQWFIVTDLGLASLKADDGLHVFARSLASAEPLADVEVSLIARNNDVLGTMRTDASGHAVMAPGLARGEGGLAPALVVAEVEGDYAFLDLAKAAFDLADRGVEGRAAPGALDPFLYTERGVYRPGSTVHLMALLRDGAAHSVDGVPLTFVIERPDGVEYRRVTSAATALGGHALDIDLSPDVLTGTWTARAYGDPKALAIAEIQFLVEDFVPERLDFALETEAETARAYERIPVTLDGRFLYGSPAGGLQTEGEVIVRPAKQAPAKLDGYRFGLADEEVQPVRDALGGLAATDAEGHAAFEVLLPELPQTTGRLEAEIVVRLREAGGRAVERSVTLPVAPDAEMIGVKPLFANDKVEESSIAGFEVVAVDPAMQRLALGGVRWELMKLNRHYEWYHLDGSWNYEPVVNASRVADGTIEITADTPARIQVPVDWGRYRLEVSGADGDGPATSVEFTAGWYAASASAETPDLLEVSLDKSRYRPGDTARVRLDPRFAGSAVVTVMAERVLAMKAVEVPADGTTVDFPVDESWGAGAYVTAMLYRPMEVEAGQNPARAIGLDWLALDTSQRSLKVAMAVPEIASPNESLAVPLTIDGLAPGEDARVTVAAVDVGILNLTAYQPPAPEDWYYGQRRLGIEIRDLYGQLIDGLQGARGELRSGGDAAGLSLKGAPPTETPVALFSGILRADAQGRAEVGFDIPSFNGTLKLMAVAWTASKVGHGVAEVIVRDPVVVTASLPRFLAPGDRSRLHLDIENVSGPVGDWRLSVEADGPVEFLGDQPSNTSLALQTGTRHALAVPISTNAIGQSTITVSLAHDPDIEIVKELNLTVRAAQPPVTRRSVQSLAAGKGRLTVTPDLVADLVPGSSVVTLAVTRGLLLDVPGLLDSLDRYSYGCAEQTTSRAMPLLYVNDLARALGLGEDAELDRRIREAITSVLQRQGADGSFGLWRAGGDDLWLDSYVTDFLTRARETGYSVPDQSFSSALDRLENGLSYANDVEGGGEHIAYALYVLARNRRASIGDLRYYVDAKIDEFGSGLALAQLGASLALYGDSERATTAFQRALTIFHEPDQTTGSRADYGSQLRDSAATLALVAESRGARISLPAVARIVERERGAKRYTSTQEQAWLLLAAHALDDSGGEMTLNVAGQAHSGRLLRRLTDQVVRTSPLTIANEGASEVQAVVTVRGVPVEPEPAASNGLTIKRDYYALAGDPVAIAEVGQNERFVVVIRVTKGTETNSRLLIEDLLPAGFEIDNPRLVQGGDVGGFAWLGETSQAVHVEFRDDRFAAAFDRNTNDDVLTLAYVVRAVTPGTYSHPAAVVEDMYDPKVNARTAHGAIEIVGPEPR